MARSASSPRGRATVRRRWLCRCRGAAASHGASFLMCAGLESLQVSHKLTFTPDCRMELRNSRDIHDIMSSWIVAVKMTDVPSGGAIGGRMRSLFSRLHVGKDSLSILGSQTSQPARRKSYRTAKDRGINDSNQSRLETSTMSG